MRECVGESDLLGINLNKVCSGAKFYIDHLTSSHIFPLFVSLGMLLNSKIPLRKTLSYLVSHRLLPSI